MGLILLVDDEPMMGSLVEMTLEGLDYELVQVGTLSEGIAKTKELRPDVVLLDLSLSAEDGLDLLPELKGDPELEKITVLVFSIHDSRKKEALAAGVDGFLAKPFKPSELKTLIAATKR